MIADDSSHCQPVDAEFTFDLFVLQFQTRTTGYMTTECYKQSGV